MDYANTVWFGWLAHPCARLPFQAWRIPRHVPERIASGSSLKTRKLEELPFDRDWHTIARISLRPHRNLSQEQAAAVRREYAFDGDVLVVETRKAIELYADRRWNLDRDEARLERVGTEYIEARPDSETP
ncbi:hypothetical protein JJB09_07695 [Rhizobium sp. KVB221]|uniref:DNA-binding transcriptional repressor CapW C-terminal dimerisation domain-containing protein n=1 Tax=Rhizobium setariae TaxID=2801340 RepID=A0A936YK89_9HYPH|nr:hypothetical protein [Rhizobium setariae]MBL0371909.1 hypothetical protein [Rhizobium setariae]